VSRPPQIVFVDGIGGRRRFRQPLFQHFAAQGLDCHHFDYRPSRQNFVDIRAQLGNLLSAIAAQGPYVLIGYSFGGVLARAVLTGHSSAVPPPQRLILVASPITSMQMCRRFSNWAIFRWLNGDCGQLLASESQMLALLPLPSVPTTCIYGSNGYSGPHALAGREANDGMVAVSEASPHLFADVVAVHASHPFIATCGAVIKAIQDRLPR